MLGCGGARGYHGIRSLAFPGGGRPGYRQVESIGCHSAGLLIRGRAQAKRGRAVGSGDGFVARRSRPGVFPTRPQSPRGVTHPPSISRSLQSGRVHRGPGYFPATDSSAPSSNRWFPPLPDSRCGRRICLLSRHLPARVTAVTARSAFVSPKERDQRVAADGVTAAGASSRPGW